MLLFIVVYHTIRVQWTPDTLNLEGKEDLVEVQIIEGRVSKKMI